MNRPALFLSALLTSFLLVLAGALVGNMRSSAPEIAATSTVEEQIAPVEAVGAGEANQMTGAAQVPKAPQTPADAAASQEAIDATLQAAESIIKQREAQYQQLLEQANRQLQEAYAKQRELAEAARKAQEAQAQAEQLAQQMAEQLAAIQAAQAAQAQAAAPPPAPASSAERAQAAPQFPVTPEQAVQVAQSVANGAALTGQPELVLFEGTPAYEVPFDRGFIYVDANTAAVLYNGTVPPPPPPQTGGGEQEAHEDDEHEEREHEDDDREEHKDDDDNDHKEREHEDDDDDHEEHEDDD